MSKGLEALCYLDDIAHGRKMSLDPHELKLIVEKELKALEIIKVKGIDIDILKYHKDLEHYNFAIRGRFEHLTKEEYDLLKEVLL